MTRSIRTWFFLGLVLVLVTAGAAFLYRSISTLIDERTWVEHTLSVLSEIAAVRSSLSEADAAVVRFQLRSEPEYANAVHDAFSRADLHLHALEVLTSDNPSQRDRLRSIKPQIDELALLFDEQLVWPRQLPNTSKSMLTLSDKRIRSIAGLFDEMSIEEHSLLELRSQSARKSARISRVGIVLIASLNFVMLVAFGLLIQIDSARARQFTESRNLIASIVDSSQDAIIGKTLEGTITSWNRGAEQMYGYKATEMIGRPIYLLAPKDRAAEIDDILRSLRNGQSVNQFESLRMAKDGRRLNVSITVSPVRDESGQIVAASAIVRDVSIQKRAEEALRTSEEQYRLLFISNPLPMWVFDVETLQFLAVNEAAVDHYGYSKREFLQMTIPDIRPPEDVPRLLEAISRPVPERDLSGRWRHQKKDGTVIWAEITSQPLMFMGKKAELVTVNDVTERIKSEEQLWQSEERFSKAFLSSPVAMSIATLGGERYIDVNTAFLSLIARGREEVIGRSAEDIELWVNAEDHKSMADQLEQSGKIGKMETYFKTQHGEVRRVVLAAEIIELQGARCVLTIANDITEATRLEEQFRQAQKMEAVGRLAGGVAHDFNNVLGVVIGYAELIREEASASPRITHQAAEILKASERAASITRQLLVFSRQQILQPRIINLNDVITGLTSLLQRLIMDNVELRLDLDSSLGNIKADANQIEQILMNLAVNAKDAMPRGGKLIIQTTNAELDETYSTRHMTVVPGQYVMLSVSDTGQGMDEQTVSRIFEPFFTTKPVGKGTGLGLSIVYGVVKQSAGYIWVYSEPAKGTTFKIYLPRVDEPVSLSKEAVAAASKASEAFETILVVEDDDSMRELICTMLRSSGYQVVEANSGNNALTLARDHARIDLLLTDIMMPGIYGEEVAAQARALHPELKVVFMSGYTGDLIAHHGMSLGDADVLYKPFTRDALLHRLRATLQ